MTNAVPGLGWPEQETSGHVTRSHGSGGNAAFGMVDPGKSWVAAVAGAPVLEPFAGRVDIAGPQSGSANPGRHAGRMGLGWPGLTVEVTEIGPRATRFRETSARSGMPAGSAPAYGAEVPRGSGGPADTGPAYGAEVPRGSGPHSGPGLGTGAEVSQGHGIPAGSAEGGPAAGSPAAAYAAAASGGGSGPVHSAESGEVAGRAELADGLARGGLGSESASAPGEPAEAPARVRQALAAVSRETAIGPPGTRGTAGGAERRAEARRRPDAGQPDNEREGQVSIPSVPAQPAASDTPIARAAQAAVVARSGTEIWPRPPACRIITIANQKGGVGKTTTAVNLAAGLAMHGSRVLVIDLDPQGNASTALDVDHHSGIASVYNVLVDSEPLGSVVRPVTGFPHLYCAPAAIDLAGAEIELVPMVARESRLARAVAGYDASNLDYIFIDCPPSLGLLTVNALVAAPEVLIPIQCEYYALEGLEQLLRTVDLVRSHLNPALAVSTILLTMYDGRTRLAAQVADEVREHFGGVVLGPVIPRSVRVSEAPSYGQSVMTYDPGSTGAQAYFEAARELALRNVHQPAG